MYSFYKKFEKEKISFAYFGIISDTITEMLIDLSDNYLSKSKDFLKFKRKASFLIAESFQNIIRHGVLKKDDITDYQYKKDFFHISVFEDRFIVSTTNVLENNKVKSLEDKIKRINSLNPEELKALQLEILTDTALSDKGGAGLGLIEMVRRSGLPMLYKVIQLTEGYSIIVMNLEMSISGRTENAEHKVSIDEIENLYRKLTESDILLIYKGDFSEDSNKNLIELLYNNFEADKNIISNKIKNIVSVIEVMQNVSKHGKQIRGNQEGILSLSIKNDEIYIECSNFVKHQDYKPFKKRLKTIKNSSIDDLEKAYKKQLKASIRNNSKNSGLGLLEIARFTQNRFSYSFVETENDEIFFSIKFKTI
jgi:hypothetical protein